jgi:peptidoglycan/LPS O-acetylase OafA/YrhL
VSEPPAQRLAYRPALDGLRGMAVLAVMLYHFGMPWLQGGFLGVDLFFVLSGFLITSLLLDEWRRFGTIDLPRFYARRALRLLPALFVLLAVLAVLAETVLPETQRPAIWRGIGWTLAYAANWQKVFSSEPVGMLGHTWSLSIEEQFYVIWPPLLLVLLWRGVAPRSLLRLALLGAGLSAALRCGLLFAGAASTEALYNGLHTRADALLIGCAAALLPAAGLAPRLAWPRWAGQAAGLGFPMGLCLPFATARLDAPRMYYAGFVLFACAAAVFVLGLATDQVSGAVLEWRPLVWLGARSYGVYLWHLPVHDTLSALGASSWSISAAAGVDLAISLGLAALSYRLIEAPALRLKSRFAGRPFAGAGRAPLTPSPVYGLVRIE